MLSATSGSGFLASLRVKDLHRIAVSAGVAVTGTKSCLISRLESEISRVRRPRVSPAGALQKRVLSIDMGIRNLAYAYLVPQQESPSSLPLSLMGWNRIVIAPNPKESPSTLADSSANPTKEPFDPATYSKYAYSLITNLLRQYDPTHILIERQRFRSGGGSAVQEWTIRVGVFEGMLYAVLEALRMQGESSWKGQAHGVDPGRVARYWLGDGAGGSKGKTGKMAIVRRWLEAGEKETKIRLPSSTTQVESSSIGDVATTIASYLEKGRRQQRNGAPTSRNDPGKVDDLADCLLQGVAWLEWDGTKEEVAQDGWEALVERLGIELSIKS